jgi:hypothetical protein
MEQMIVEHWRLQNIYLHVETAFRLHHKLGARSFLPSEVAAPALRSSLISREMRRLKVSNDFNTGFRSLHAAYTITMYNVG